LILLLSNHLKLPSRQPLQGHFLLRVQYFVVPVEGKQLLLPKRQQKIGMSAKCEGREEERILRLLVQV
jgi:hypothetical protein